MKRKQIIFSFIAGIVLCVIIASFFIYLKNDATEMSPDAVKVSFQEGSFMAKVVSNDEERTKGLSGTASLADNEAMLFVFPSEERWGIWMKDMNYAIDIIWLNAAKEVIHIKESATPESYLQKESFRPEEKAKYVLEVMAGSVEKYNISTGFTADFTLKGGQL